MSIYTLFGYPGSGSAAVELALTAGGIAHEVRSLDPDAGDLTSAAFLAVNPRGQVPALRLPDGSVVTEIPAILNHLADAHPHSGLAPPPGSPARAQHDRWLSFVHVNVYEAALRVFYAGRYTTDPAGAEGVRDAALAYLLRHLALLEGALGEGPFMLGQAPMAVDHVLWTVASWLDPGTVATAAPRIQSLVDAVAADVRLGPVIARHL